MDDRSRDLRLLALDALEGGERGHVGSTMSLIEIMRVLFDDVLRYKALDPSWEDRDRLLLSKGHGCIALYTLLADKGFFHPEHLKTFCRFESFLGGHPERGHVPGVEASTGSLGHGLSIGVGIAKALKLKRKAQEVFVVAGDGEMNEGSMWEAMIAASHHRLDNLVLIVDANGLQSFGPTDEVWAMKGLTEKISSFGWNAIEVDGHDIASLRSALESRRLKDAPLGIVAKTVKGKGISFAEGNPYWHHKSRIDSTEVASLRSEVERYA